jgi:hypothetical protein
MEKSIMFTTAKIGDLPWKLVQQWDADGVVRHIEKYDISAVHKPRTVFSNEKIIILRGNSKIIREKISNKWTEPFYE